jgi:low affinity Fe/Cu permease
MTRVGDSQDKEPLKPSQVDPHQKWFDRFSTAVADTVAKAWFFLACVATIIIWAPTYFIFRNLDTYQLLINTWTTLITYLLVALLQNTQSRDAKAIHRKLNAIADALADSMESRQKDDPDLRGDVAELREAVGLEHREGT